MFADLLKRIEDISENDWARSVRPDDVFWTRMKEWLNNIILPEFVYRFSNEIDEIIRIDPDLSEREILENVAMQMVQSLEAINASVRIYDPDADQLLSFGSWPQEEETRETHISLENSIAGDVLKSGREFLVPNIMKEDKYLDKTIVERKGANSLLAIPFEIPTFFPHERSTVGVIQIYFSQVDRSFSPLEVRMARLMANRLGFVIARKKILSMQKVNVKKEKIVRQIFQKLGSSQGVKMKDIFNRIIPELADIVNLQYCALFSVSSDRNNVVLEAGYPDSTSYHGIGKSFPINSEPAFELVVGLKE
ncbi:MAG: GAF domain-containing protein, partial [Deltaproteobacteria bacterium]|nr:GAF domain-containing protein [Deltaproteobacteria bacterium]